MTKDMTNKLPVVGKRYKEKSNIMSIDSIKMKANEIWIYFDDEATSINAKDFWNCFEELPEEKEDNLQKEPKLQVAEIFTPEVREAMEELIKLNSPAGQLMTHATAIEELNKFRICSLNLLNALDNHASNSHQIKEAFAGNNAEELKEVEAVYLSNKETDTCKKQKQKIDEILRPLFFLHDKMNENEEDDFYYRAYVGDEIDRVKEILNKNMCQNSEKSDISEEYVDDIYVAELKQERSIWKPVSELPKQHDNVYADIPCLILDAQGYYRYGLFSVNNFYEHHGRLLEIGKYHEPIKYATLTDFVNLVTSLDERVRKLETTNKEE